MSESYKHYSSVVLKAMEDAQKNMDINEVINFFWEVSKKAERISKETIETKYSENTLK